MSASDKLRRIWQAIVAAWCALLNLLARVAPADPLPAVPALTTETTMSFIPNFHIVFVNDAQKAVIKAALADAGQVVEVAAKSAADDLVLALKASPVGTFIASEIATLKDSSLTGLEKMEQVVTNAIPTAVALFATGGVTATADQVEDAVRGAAQLIYNQTMSTTVPALATDAEKIVTAILDPSATGTAAAAPATTAA